MYPGRLLQMLGIVLAVSLSSATAARAQSAIVGTVLDAETKKPLADVVVSATSPGLQGQRTVVTDLQGQYQIPSLPLSVYTLRFVKESYRPFSRSELRLRPGRTVRVTVELLPDDDIEISILPNPPTVDVGSTSTGMNVDQESLPSVPVTRPTDRGGAARSFEHLAGLAPGVQSEADGLSINGASPFENTYGVDGLSTTDPILGANALPLSVEFLEEVNVLTGGYMPEDGHATGGILRTRTRWGSYKLHGSVFGHWVPGFLGGTPTPASGPTWTISGRNALQHQGTLGATLGGPILNQLRFFAGVAPAVTRVEHTRTLNAREPGTGAITPIPGTSRFFSAQERSLQALGKLTYLFGERWSHRVSLSLITTPSRSGGEGPLTVDPRTGGVRELLNGHPDSLPQRRLDSDFTRAALEYSGAFLEKRLRVDAHLGWSRQTLSRRSQSPFARETFAGPVTRFEPSPDAVLACGTDPAEQLARCPVLDYETGGDNASALDSVDRYQANVQATGLMNFLGAHVVKAGVDAEHLDSERTRSSNIVWDGRAQHLEQSVWYTRETLGGFLQDSWTLANQLTVNAGVRYDLEWLYTPRGGQAFSAGRQLSPRVGLILDPLATGQMKLFAHYAKYRGQLPLALMTRVGEAIDPGLAPPSSSELVAGAELEVFKVNRLIATYTHRGLDSVIEDLSRDGSSFFLGNPGLGMASDFPKAERTYDAVTVALSRAFSDGWLAEASYTGSRLYGNYAGPFRPAAGWGEPALQSDFDLPSQLTNRLGLLPNDRTHTVKVFAARKHLSLSQALSVDFGLSYRGRSGAPINYLGGHPSQGLGETFVLPRGSTGERTPWVHSLDPHLELHYWLRRRRSVSLSVQVFNVFNFQGVTRVNEHYTYASVLPLEARVEAGQLTPDRVQRTDGASLTERDLNGEFKKPTQYQAPRQVRIGLRYTF